jgi:hypothetical protein
MFKKRPQKRKNRLSRYKNIEGESDQTGRDEKGGRRRK